VLVAGRCLAAHDSYSSHAIYVNAGKTFTTNEEANSKLDDLKTLKDIETYARKNVKTFFP
jgi:hypothetical protein